MCVCVCVPMRVKVWVWVFLWMSHGCQCGHTATTAAMCVLFVDKFAGCVLLCVSGPDQTHSEVMEHAGVTLRMTDGEPLKMAQLNH